MDRYRAGALAEAIGYWEPIYRELGASEGYRLAYDLGIAYAELGDATHGAERLLAFLSGVDERRAGGESIPEVVRKEEADARSRVAGLLATRGRIRVDPGSPARPVQVDLDEPRLVAYVAWVTPGDHQVTFAPHAADAQVVPVHVEAGAVVDVSAPAPAAPPAAEAPPAVAPIAPIVPAPTPSPPALVPVAPVYTVQRPFSAGIVYAAGGLTAAATALAIVLEIHASTLHDQFATEQAQRGSIPPTDRDSFGQARTQAYVSVGSAIALGAMTAGLSAWYLLGGSRALKPTLGASGGMAEMGFAAAF